MQTQEQTDPDRGPFTAIPDYVFDLPLSPQSFRVYMHIKTLHDSERSFDGIKEAARVCLMSPNSIRSALRDLESFGLVENKSPQSSIGFGSQCSWCGCFTAWLHEHHYPIRKADGGKETVNICPNCHAEFHALTRDRYVIAEAAE